MMLPLPAWAVILPQLKLASVSLTAECRILTMWLFTSKNTLQWYSQSTRSFQVSFELWNELQPSMMESWTQGTFLFSQQKLLHTAVFFVSDSCVSLDLLTLLSSPSCTLKKIWFSLKQWTVPQYKLYIMLLKISPSKQFSPLLWQLSPFKFLGHR